MLSASLLSIFFQFYFLCEFGRRTNELSTAIVYKVFSQNRHKKSTKLVRIFVALLDLMVLVLHANKIVLLLTY